VVHRTLIRDAEVVFPNQVCHSNILIEDTKIAAIDAARDQPADEVIEGAGLTLMPGAIDDQVHFREPGLTHKEDLETGSIGCAAGGITTFIEMPNTKPTTTDTAAWQWKLQRAAEVSRVNFQFYLGATGRNNQFLKSEPHAPGIKIFIGSSTGDLLVDDQEALEGIFAETTLPICAHCEDETTVQANRRRLGEQLTIEDHSRIRDVQAAVVATRRAIDLATRHKHRFHVLHVSTADELDLLPGTQPLITAEVCPHHLFFSTHDYPRLGSLIQMNPSVKSPEHPRALWQALVENRIQVIATDHAPHTLEEKSQPYPASPSGLPAVENVLALMLNEVHQGRIGLLEIVQRMCDAPARVWGLVGKGRIERGYDADLVLVDMQLQKTIQNELQLTKSRWSPWAGSSLKGWPVRTIVLGQTVYEHGAFHHQVRGQAAFCDHARGGYWATPDGIGR
jgi:dihydroorotase